MKATTAAAAAAAADADAVPVGAVDMPNCHPRSHQSTAGPTVTAITVANNAHILLVDTRRKRPYPI